MQPAVGMLYTCTIEQKWAAVLEIYWVGKGLLVGLGISHYLLPPKEWERPELDSGESK